MHKSFPTLMLPEIMQHPQDFRLLKALFVSDKKEALLNQQSVTLLDLAKLEEYQQSKLQPSKLLIGCKVAQDLAMLECSCVQLNSAQDILISVDRVQFYSLPLSPKIIPNLLQICQNSELVAFETEAELKELEDSLSLDDLVSLNLAALSQTGITLNQILLHHDYFLKSQAEQAEIVDETYRITPNQNAALGQGLALSFALYKQPDVISNLIKVGKENTMRNQELKKMLEQMDNLEKSLNNLEQKLTESPSQYQAFEQQITKQLFTELTKLVPAQSTINDIKSIVQDLQQKYAQGQFTPNGSLNNYAGQQAFYGSPNNNLGQYAPNAAPNNNAGRYAPNGTPNSYAGQQSSYGSQNGNAGQYAQNGSPSYFNQYAPNGSPSSNSGQNASNRQPNDFPDYSQYRHWQPRNKQPYHNPDWKPKQNQQS